MKDTYTFPGLLDHRIPEYSDLEGIYKDYWLQLLSEWPIWGSSPQSWCYYHHAVTDQMDIYSALTFISKSSREEFFANNKWWKAGAYFTHFEVGKKSSFRTDFS